MSAPEERVIRIGADLRAPRLSVLTPFHRHDPAPLLARMAHAPPGVEFILLDDGSGSAPLLAGVVESAMRLGGGARLIVWPDNRGRAAARNRLIGEARGEYVLFLDADMLPDSPRFLRNWLGIIDTQRPYVAFGGLSLRHAARTKQTALHYNLFAHSDCRHPHQRERAPAQFTASANLLAHRDFLAANPFDDEFVGWGFEDVDWALRAAQHAPILHVDNPATHAGLDDVETLLRKGAEAGPNFARLARKHPERVARFGAHRIARVLKLSPARAALRDAMAWLARDPLGAAPMALRRAALKLYRVAHYAEHLS